MGLSALRGSAVYDYVSTWIPRETDVIQRQLYANYDVTVLPQYMSTLGTMCDYGVRARFPKHDFGYIEISMAMNGDIPEIVKLLKKGYLSAEDAYVLSTYKDTQHFSAPKLSDAMWDDYVVLTERAVGMYRSLRLLYGYYGAYYNSDKVVHSFECDCVDDRTVIDMKVSRTSVHSREHWTQVLLYSLLTCRRDMRQRSHIGLIYPVQGVIKEFIIHPQEYVALLEVFNQMYDKEILCI